MSLTPIQIYLSNDIMKKSNTYNNSHLIIIFFRKVRLQCMHNINYNACIRSGDKISFYLLYEQ